MKLQLVRAPGCKRLPPRVREVSESLAARLAPRWLQVQAVLGDDRLLRRLNRDFRGHDRTTDVLSFRYDRARPRHRDAPHAELYVSVERARRQARERHHSLSREVIQLILHGLLHLQGHDHETAPEARRMRAAERRQLLWLQRHFAWPRHVPWVPAAGTGPQPRSTGA